MVDSQFSAAYVPTDFSPTRSASPWDLRPCSTSVRAQYAHPFDSRLVFFSRQEIEKGNEAACQRTEQIGNRVTFADRMLFLHVSGLQAKPEAQGELARVNNRT